MLARVICISALTLGTLLYGNHAQAKTCGQQEVRKLEQFSDYVCDKRNMLNAMAKADNISDVRRLSLKLLADNLHSVYLVTARMQDMITVSCNVLMCSELDVQLLTKTFERQNMGLDGLEFAIIALKQQFESTSMKDLTDICMEVEQKINDASILSWKFYANLYEMRGEKPPLSP